ncbi:MULTISPECIES: hypothetical protein [Ramlibacter]|uniref:Uncharacterized protein n=1 Tax=Ramlibacter aquaticus TaxID=2780094 RepID=A0ABR9SJA9_9BURK|nr:MULTISPECIES: hypothetical protein [Ramlibacter]MBE7942435.1 hypothetical protein [Ramlibacter aquaticus]
MPDPDRTASLMTPAKMARVQPRAAANPAAYLDAMASDVGHQHVARLAQLRVELEQQAQQRDYAPLAAQLQRVADALPQLDFSLLERRGLLARLTGKGRSAGAGFCAQYEQQKAELAALQGLLEGLQARQGGQASRTDLTLLELEVEYRAIDKIIDQGARWLQDMRNQLKTRGAAATTDEERQQLRLEAARCETLVARLKALRAASGAAQQAHQQAQASAARRAAIVQALQQVAATRVRAWRQRLDPVAEDAAETGSTRLSLEGPMDCHRELQLGIKQALADCGQLQAHEAGLATGLQALAAQLQAMQA